MSSFSYFVGQRIKKYRKSRGYTIEQFSAMINKSKATLSKYENGAITIDIETLYEIAQALDIDMKCFIDYQPPIFRTEPALPKNNYISFSLAFTRKASGMPSTPYRIYTSSPGVRGSSSSAANSSFASRIFSSGMPASSSRSL